MAEYLIFKKNAGKKTPGDGHWMDDIDLPNYILKFGEKFQNMYDMRDEVGDIIQVEENGKFAPNHFRKDRFYVVRVVDQSVQGAKQFARNWRRQVTVERITNDTVNHIYDYKFTLVPLGTSLKDRFSQIKDKARFLPPDITILSKTPTEVVMRLQPQGVTDEEKIQRKEKVEETGKEILSFLRKKIKRRRYGVLVGSLPVGIKNKLQTDGWIEVTKAQAQPYIRDKANE